MNEKCYTLLDRIRNEARKLSDDKSERCCGACCYFKYEDTDGYGWCDKLAEFNLEGVVHCSDPCICDSFVSCEDKRHYMAMLRKCQRCLLSNVGTGNNADVVEISKSIDFVVDYLKSY